MSDYQPKATFLTSISRPDTYCSSQIVDDYRSGAYATTAQDATLIVNAALTSWQIKITSLWIG